MSLPMSQASSDAVVYTPTRSQHREHLLQLARTTRVQSVLRVSSVAQAELFVALAGYNSTIALAVEDLEISFQLQVGYPANLLRRFLALLGNIETLTLHLPLTSPPTILNGLLFPRLSVFDTNLPHRYLVSFLSAHPALASLTLRACRCRTVCIACGQITSATVSLTRMASMAAMAINALSTSPLWCLTIDFFSDDHDILARIASAAPNLRKLKLIEKPRAQRRFRHTRRPWNDVRQWHLTLLRLPHLEELLLRTHLTVTSPRRSEDAVVCAWANGVGSRSMHHPSLFHICLLQGTGVGVPPKLYLPWPPLLSATPPLLLLLSTVSSATRHSPQTNPCMEASCEDELRESQASIVNSGLSGLHQLLKDGNRGLNAMETRWEVRFQCVEHEIEELASRNARVLRTVHDMKREQTSTTMRTSQLEADVENVYSRVAELSESVGTLLTDMKDHLRHEKELLNDKWGSLRRGLDELSQKVARVDFDLEIMKSQRSVDRARTEQVQNGLAVLEACSTATTNTVQRLECDIARLEHISEQHALTVEQLASAQADSLIAQDVSSNLNGRTLAEELSHGDHLEPMVDDTACGTAGVVIRSSQSILESELLGEVRDDVNILPTVSSADDASSDDVPASTLRSSSVSDVSQASTEDTPCDAALNTDVLSSMRLSLGHSPPPWRIAWQQALLPIGRSLFDKKTSRTALPAAAMASTSKKKPCVCSQCSLSTYLDEYGLKQKGALQYPKTVKQHLARDQLLEKKCAIQQEVLADAVLIATVGDLDPPHATVDSDSSDASPSEPRVAIGDDVNGGDNTIVDNNNQQCATTDEEIKTRVDKIASLQSTFAHYDRLVSLSTPLTFVSTPVHLDDPPAEVARSGSAALNFVDYRQWLSSTILSLARLPDLGDRNVDNQLASLLVRLNSRADTMDRFMRDCWEAEKVRAGLYNLQPGSDQGPIFSSHAIPSRASLKPFITAALVMTTLLHAVASVSRPYSNFVLATIRVLLHGAFIYCNRSSSSATSTLSALQHEVVQTIPKDVRTALQALGIAPDILRYAACPRCFQIYPPDHSRPDDPYPHHCTFSETDKGPCGSPLVVAKEREPLKKGGPSRLTYRPIKPYPYRTFKSWLAALFSRPDVEKFLAGSWDHAVPSGGRWTDIFHAPGIREFRGPDGKLFSHEPDGACHLVFSLFVDWFNPFGNKKAGKSHSVGAIYLACLNLPPHLRFRPENIYLAAIIPGPKEPSLDQLNHLLRPLVDELYELWARGLFLERTALRFVGRFLRVALVPLVCDLPALRKAAGFASHAAKWFCSFCRLIKKLICNIERATWPTRSAKEHRHLAAQWRDAATEAERQGLFKEHGVRWSELLRLPYWDPIRFPVVDAMHNLLLGNLRHHCMDVWGIDIKGRMGKKIAPHTPEEQASWLRRVVDGIKSDSKHALGKVRVGYLATVAQVNDISPGMKLVKRAYIAALLHWAKSHPIEELKLPPVLQEDAVEFHLAEGLYDISKFRVLTPEVLVAIRQDIARTSFPSWMERPPHNFGSATHGKLKADQWRTVCTVSLFITLTRLWGDASAESKEGVLLDNFVHLVAATELATRRSMDSARAHAYDEHMRQYLRGLLEIFSHQLVPNHHLSLHLTACLLLFGPVHGWWGYPFERYNGILGGLNINNIAEHIPLTFMNGFYAAVGLRELMATVEWPDAVEYRDMMDAYRRAFQDTSRGTRVTDASSLGHEQATADSIHTAYDRGNSVTLDRPFYQALLRWMPAGFAPYYATADDSRPRIAPHVQRAPSISHLGLTFATRQHGTRNSFVIFTHPDNASKCAGQIVDIVIHSRIEGDARVLAAFVVVDVYADLTPTHSEMDPYRRFRDLETRLYYNHFQQTVLIKLEDVVAHFASLTYTPANIGVECIVARPLDRS
ncbi:hypothetical protein BN946_scf184951.g8 [Trametes cinnabarina]|uniref:Uncharacterized protein n=1 Tax=Pycnoporus cinnabarinus TaxID=5643 RepID=A0A060SN79_PYCCI|nr:hypothetical protein BN946_scf184951.g8 [Trametes cinnabarina]